MNNNIYSCSSKRRCTTPLLASPKRFPRISEQTRVLHLDAMVSRVENNKYFDILSLKLPSRAEPIKLSVLVDTGSQVTLISKSLVMELNLMPNILDVIYVVDLTGDRTEAPAVIIPVEYRKVEFPSKMYVMEGLENIVKAAILLGMDMVTKVGEEHGEWSIKFEKKKPKKISTFPSTPVPSNPKLAYDFQGHGDIIQTAQTFHLKVHQVLGAIEQEKSRDWMDQVNPNWYTNLISYQNLLTEQLQALENDIEINGITKEKQQQILSVKSTLKQTGKAIKQGAKKASKFTSEKIKVGASYLKDKISKELEKAFLDKKSLGAGRVDITMRFKDSPEPITMDKLKFVGDYVSRQLESKGFTLVEQPGIIDIPGTKMNKFVYSDNSKVKLEMVSYPKPSKYREQFLPKWKFQGFITIYLISEHAVDLEIKLSLPGKKGSTVSVPYTQPLVQELAAILKNGMDYIF